jgi:hypothetical protein
MSAQQVRELEERLMQSVQVARDDIAKEKKRISRKEETLRKEKQRIQMELSRMGDLHKINSKLVTLNVGGQTFTTAAATLCSFPGSFIEAMFSGRHPQSRDDQGNYFIDRSPVVFEYVLNFLRTNVLVEPDTLDMRRRVRLDLDFFGLTEFAFGGAHPSFQGTSLLEAVDKRLLSGWTDNATSGNMTAWRLAYKGSRDGFAADTFHEHCDDVGETLVVVRDHNGWVFGGYASEPWTSGGGYRSDANAWLFALRRQNGDNDAEPVYAPEKLEQTGANPRQAVYHHPGYGACFGGVHAFSISTSCNQNFVSSSNVGSSFRQSASGVPNISERKKFKVTEIEVFRRG